MTENYEHYITKNIKAFYKRRLFSPIVYLLLLAVLWFTFPLPDMLHPALLNASDSLADTYQNKSRYVQATFTDLKFSGYTSEQYGMTFGYYYYTMHNGQ